VAEPGDAVSGRRGFTIVELLVAIVVAGVAVVGIYYYYSSVQYAMREQAKISQAQLSARLGMELLSADLQRAGFLSTPNGAADPLVCAQSPVRDVVALVHYNGTAGKVYARNATGAPGLDLPNGSQNTNIRPDSIQVFGNYVNSNEYLVETISGTTIRLQQLLDDPDPTEADAGVGGASAASVLTDAEFGWLFPTNSLLRIVNRHGFAQFVRVAGVSGFADRTITVAGATAPTVFSPSTPCGVEGFCEGCTVNVVNGLWYRLERRTDDATTANVDEGLQTDLVRYLLDTSVDPPAPIAASREVVVEYAVDFQVWFRAATAGGVPGTFALDVADDVADDSTVMLGVGAPLPGARPEAMRSAVVRVTVRTRAEDPKFPFDGRARPNTTQRIKAFEVEPTSTGAAHVRSYTTEVALPNLAFRGLL